MSRASRRWLVLVATLVAAPLQAAEPEAVNKMMALNKAALAAHGAGDHDEAKEKLLEAVVLGKEGGLSTHAAMARTYLHLGAVYIDGLKDREKGLRHLGMALKIRSDIEMTQALATDAVMKEFNQARADVGLGPVATASAKEPAPTKAAAPVADSKAEKKARQELENVKSELEKVKGEVEEVRESEKKTRAERDRLANELLDLQKQDKSRQAAAAKDRDKQVADANAREQKMREERDRLQKSKADLEGKLAEVTEREKHERLEKERVQREKEALEKRLAETQQRERTERDAREKLEKQRLVAEGREAARKEREEKDRIDREQQLAGPELPRSVPQAVYCPVPSDAPAGRDLVVHCVAQPGVKANAVVLHYRPSGTLQYNAAVMEKTSRGWYVATIPASWVRGKSLQYFAEARGGRDEVLAANGKAVSPNVLTVRGAAAEASATRQGRARAR